MFHEWARSDFVLNFSIRRQYWKLKCVYLSLFIYADVIFVPLYKGLSGDDDVNFGTEGRQLSAEQFLMRLLLDYVL